jgi:RNA polymerase sigma-70 factor (ECF subfamily)
MNSLRAETRTRNESFNSTRWTLVLAAGDSDATRSQSNEALSELCRIYWRPLYLFLRREGIGAEDAQDLTQGFFAHLIESRAYAREVGGHANWYRSPSNSAAAARPSIPTTR